MATVRIAHHIAGMRVEYPSVLQDCAPGLEVAALTDGRLSLFRTWVADAERAALAEPNAIVLASGGGRTGQPVSRSVLCKSADESGITFLTNYDSAKGDELTETLYASATFPWYELGRQVHIRGPVSKADRRVSDNYWSKRPRRSQPGVWASQQSRPIASRAALVDQLAEVTKHFAGSQLVPAPPHWGGYLIAPEVVEFWQGRETRCTTGYALS